MNWLIENKDWLLVLAFWALLFIWALIREARKTPVGWVCPYCHWEVTGKTCPWCGSEEPI